MPYTDLFPNCYVLSSLGSIMPSLARKVLVAATVDGLFIQPLNTKKEQRQSPPVKIRYGDSTISFVSRDSFPEISNPKSSFEAFGIVGTLLDASYSRLFFPMEYSSLPTRPETHNLSRVGHRLPLQLSRLDNPKTTSRIDSRPTCLRHHRSCLDAMFLVQRC